MSTRILVVGAGGLLGRHLLSRGPYGVGRECDVTRPDHREAALQRYRPDLVIFCAAVTDVDRCQRDPATWWVNAEAPAEWARRVPVCLVSTNYVFSGSGPHPPSALPAPLNAYGRQKAAAEEEVLALGGSVVRTGWLFGPRGRNFPSRLPDLLAGGPVRALTSPIVQPTFAGDLADHILELHDGITHAVGSEETTWFLFAERLAEMLGMAGRVLPVSRDQVPLLAPRPDDARLDPATLPGWTSRLHHLLPPGRRETW